MAKKRTGGDHKTKRQAFQLPQPWARVTRILASQDEKIPLWFIIKLLGEAAEKAGEEHPPYPWDGGGDDAE